MLEKVVPRLSKAFVGATTLFFFIINNFTVTFNKIHNDTLLLLPNQIEQNITFIMLCHVTTTVLGTD